MIRGNERNDIRMLHALTFGKEARTFAKSRQILLTVRKTGTRRVTAVTRPINRIRGLKIVESKLVVVKNQLTPEKMEIDSDDNTRNMTDNTERRSVLKNLNDPQSNCCQGCSEVLYQCETGDESDATSVGTANINRQDRFIPNILRNIKAVENIVNNNCGKTNFEICHKTEDKNTRRNRKQVLRPLIYRHDCTTKHYCCNNMNNFSQSSPRSGDQNSAEESETESLMSNLKDKAKKTRVERGRKKYRRRKKNTVNRSTRRLRDQNIAEETETESPSVTASNLGDADKEVSVEMEAEGSAAAEKNGEDDVYSAELNIPEDVYPPSPVKTDVDHTDESMKEILDEFEVADYQNYISSEDINFYIDEMDKLLSSDVDGSLVGHDVNDNTVDSYGNGWEKRKNNKRKAFYVRSNTGYYKEDSSEPANKARKVRCYRDLDDICSGRFQPYKSYQSSRMSRESCIIRDYYSGDGFQDLNHTAEDSSSSTDSASECEDETTSVSLPLPKIENIDNSISLVVSDVVPDRVFNDESSSEGDLDGLDSGVDAMKRQPDSSPVVEEEDVHPDSIKDDLDCSKTLSELEFFNGLLAHNILNLDFTVSSHDESCKSILADSNIDFDSSQIPNTLSVIPDLDIETADDMEISKLLGLENVFPRKFQLVTDSTLQPAIIKPISELIIKEPDQSAEEETDEIVQTGCNIESEFPNVLEDQSILFENYEGEFKWQDSQPGRDELVSSDNQETEDIDEKKSGDRCSTPLLTKGENTEESKMSKLESLLTRPKICNSVISSDENPSPRATEHQNTEYTDDTEDAQSQVAEELYTEGEEDTETDSDEIDFCNQRKVMIERLFEFDSSHDRFSNRYQLYV